MSVYQNICDVYATIKEIADKLPAGEFQDGYDECLFQFMYAFKKMDHINLHVANKNLSDENYDLKNKLKSSETQIAFGLKNQNNQLLQSNKNLRFEVSSLIEQNKKLKRKLGVGV